LHPDITNRLNERTLGDFLLFDCNWTLDTTFFADIQTLPTAHQLTVASTGLKRHKYWQLGLPERVSFRREEEYVEGFRERLEQAVSDRLRTGKVSIGLSGGLDSTNMVLAARNVADKHGEQTDLRAFTTVYDTLIPDNERHYSGVAARSLNIPIDYLCADFDLPYDGWGELIAYHPEPFHDPCGISNINLYKSCSKHGAVLLDGGGGDEIFRPANVVTELREHGLSRALTDYCRTVFRHHFFPCLGTGILARFRKLFRPTVNPNAAQTLPDWLNPEFARRLSLEDRLPLWECQRFDPLDALATPPVRRFIATLWNRYLCRCDIAHYREPVEIRFPYLDLRVVSFGLSLPRMPWGCNKHLLRRLGATNLPREITSRPKTGLRGDPIARSLEQNRQLLLKLAELPLVPLLEEMICVSQWRKSLRETSFQSWPLWESLRVVTLNYWLERNVTAKQEF
jgi:asparagine synthase (glutamine-hydrolysing)